MFVNVMTMIITTTTTSTLTNTSIAATNPAAGFCADFMRLFV